jgi:Phage P22-like portal protein
MDGVAAEASPPSVELPSGYDDVDSFLEEARKRFREGVDADRENREAAEDDLKFITGEGQWDPRVEAARRKKGRPCLRINDLPQYVGQVIGDIRINRRSIKVRPMEDADQDLADVRAGLIRSIENQSNATQVYSLAGEDQVSCGLGHFRVGLEYTDDDAFDQDIRIRHVTNTFSVVWDAFSADPTGTDARFCFVVDELDKTTFDDAYPNATTSELTVPRSYADWCSRDAVRVTEYWLMTSAARTIALVQQAPEAAPKIVDVTGREEEFAAVILAGPDGRPRLRQVQRREAWMYLITGSEVLEGPFKLPISRLPIIKVTGREVRTGSKRYRFGLIRFAKDAMRMKNIWRSSAAEWLALSPRQQYAVNVADGAGADLLRKALKSDDMVLPYTGAQPPTRLDPPTAPAALLQEAQLAQQDIKDVTGLHDASLGMRSNETSGKAIMARERQGDVATSMYHDNLNLSLQELGKVVNELIPIVYDTARTVRVLGEDETAKIVRVNDPTAEGGLVDITKGKYDIYVETGPSYSTRRAEAAESMATAIQSMPVIGQVAADLYVAAQDWPMADQIQKRLKKAMPQEIVAEEGEEPSPEQQQAAMAQQQAQQAQQQAAQQAQQLAMQKAQLELAEQEAKTRQATAQARKAEADAVKAEIEIERARLGVVTSFGPETSPPPGSPQLGEGSPAA